MFWLYIFFWKTPASEYQNKGMQKFPLNLQLHNRVELRIKVIIWSNLPPESGYRIQPVLIQQEAYLTFFRELFTLVTSGYKGILQFTIVKTQRKLCKRRNILKPCYKNEKNVCHEVLCIILGQKLLIMHGLIFACHKQCINGVLRNFPRGNFRLQINNLIRYQSANQ